MIDKKIYPIYVDPWFGPYKGDAMDVKGHHLIEPIICYWVLRLMKPGEGYYLDSLITLVEHAHHSSGGRKSTATTEQMVDRFLHALDELRGYELVEYVEGEHSGSVWRTSTDPDSIHTWIEARAAKEAQADVIMGDGEQSVYGWYLPAYRILANIRGEEHFPMKVGQTTNTSPLARMTNHIGTAPEKPVLGFVLKIDHAEVLEKWLHIELTQRGRYIADAVGREWFRTNPEELRHILTDMAAKMTGRARENTEDTDES